MPETGTTAVVIELSDANVLLDAAAQVNADLVRPGLPAHVTVLYPFLPAAELTEDVDRSVREFAASARPTDVRLTETATAPGFVAVAAPELQPVVDAFCGLWPGVLPYGGRFGPRPDAHVTVALGATEEEAAQVGARLDRLLPVCGRAEAIHLVVATAQGWRIRLSAPLGGSGAQHM